MLSFRCCHDRLECLNLWEQIGGASKGSSSRIKFLWLIDLFPLVLTLLQVAAAVLLFFIISFIFIFFFLLVLCVHFYLFSVADFFEEEDSLARSRRLYELVKFFLVLPAKVNWDRQTSLFFSSILEVPRLLCSPTNNSLLLFL